MAIVLTACLPRLPFETLWLHNSCILHVRRLSIMAVLWSAAAQAVLVPICFWSIAGSAFMLVVHRTVPRPFWPIMVSTKSPWNRLPRAHLWTCGGMGGVLLISELFSRYFHPVFPDTKYFVSLLKKKVKKILFYCIVFGLHVYLCTMCVQYLWRPENTWCQIL